MDKADQIDADRLQLDAALLPPACARQPRQLLRGGASPHDPEADR